MFVSKFSTKCVVASISVASIALSGLPALAKEPVEAPKTIAEATAGPSNVSIWKTGDEDTTVYMMGTVHILQPTIEWQSDLFEEKWAEAGTVYFEANLLDQEVAAAAAPLIMSKGIDTSGKTFASYFTAEQAAKANSMLANLNLNLQALQNMRPWFANINLAQISIQSIGGSTEAGIEIILGNRATADDKSLRFFETLEQQISFMADTPDEDQAKMFLAGLDDLADIESSFAQLVGAWYTGDEKAIDLIMKDDMGQLPAIADSLLYNRNKAWAMELDRVINEEEGVFFVAVGAAHLAGEKSVQDYLAEQGHKSEKLNAN